MLMQKERRRLKEKDLRLPAISKRAPAKSSTEAYKCLTARARPQARPDWRAANLLIRQRR
jgi:hypothetical protein